MHSTSVCTDMGGSIVQTYCLNLAKFVFQWQSNSVEYHTRLGDRINLIKKKEKDFLNSTCVNNFNFKHTCTTCSTILQYITLVCQEITDGFCFLGEESQLSTRPDSGWGGCDCRVWVNSWKTKHKSDFDIIIAACLWKIHCAKSPRDE